MRFIRSVAVLLLISGSASAQSLRVSAAISLSEAIKTIAATYESQTQQKIELNFGASGQLSAQIIAGAPVDVFISAGVPQVDDLEKRGLLLDGTRRTIVGNTLVLVVPTHAANPPRDFESLGSDAVKKLAIGEPKSVPAGQYATQVLKHFNVLDSLGSRIVYGANVRQVVTYVQSGDVTAGIVYATDAAEFADQLQIVATAPADSHDPILYPAAVIKASQHAEEARKFLAALGSESSAAVFKSRGFSLPAPTTAPSR